MKCSRDSSAGMFKSIGGNAKVKGEDVFQQRTVQLCSVQLILSEIASFGSIDY